MTRASSRSAALTRAVLVAAAFTATCRREPPRASAEGRPSPPAAATPTCTWESGDPALDALAARLPPLLDANRKSFVGRTGAVRAFGAGEAYPQIWLRDSATLVPLSRFHEGRPALESWLVEHLAHQEDSGALFDWIAPGEPKDFPFAPQARVVYRDGPLVMTADKNTTESDQESSAILAGALAFASTGDAAWLQRDVAGRPLLERLDRALGYVHRQRLDPRTGLVVTALTADWGDVSPAHGDQGAIYLDEATPRVASLYASALFYGAARALARLQAGAGETGRADFWSAAAAAVRAAIDRELWNARGGFFRMHAELPGTGPHPPDADVFALGGNAVALLYGLADEGRTGRILAAAEQRHERYGLSTLAGSLLPPYPRGFFKHPILSDEWTYQNGGLWDWFAGRFLLGLFEQGQSEAATRHLLAIARRVEGSGGLYEWTDREGHGRGSPRYAGSGAALAQATLQGLFGIRAEADGVRLSIRLGVRDGRVRVLEPSSGRVVSYEYRVDLGRGEVRVRLLPPTRAVALEVLLPGGFEASSVRSEGKGVPFLPREVGSDHYARLEGHDFGGEVVLTVGRVDTRPGPVPVAR